MSNRMSAHRTQRAATLACLAALLCSSAHAAVYRCGNAYADVPCPQAVLIDKPDSRSDEDRVAAHDVARREAALASRMVADRESAERLLRPVVPVVPAVRVKSLPRQAALAAARTPSKRRSPGRLVVDTSGDFVAVVPRKR